MFLRLRLHPGMPGHVSQLLAAAQADRGVADYIAGIFEHPATAHDALLDPGKAHAYLTQVRHHTASRKPRR